MSSHLNDFLTRVPWTSARELLRTAEGHNEWLWMWSRTDQWLLHASNRIQKLPISKHFWNLISRAFNLLGGKFWLFKSLSDDSLITPLSADLNKSVWISTEEVSKGEAETHLPPHQKVTYYCPCCYHRCFYFCKPSLFTLGNSVMQTITFHNEEKAIKTQGKHSIPWLLLHFWRIKSISISKEQPAAMASSQTHQNFCFQC